MFYPVFSGEDLKRLALVGAFQVLIGSKMVRYKGYFVFIENKYHLP